MATKQDLTKYFFKGESVTIHLFAKNADGSKLSDPSDQTLILTLATSTKGEPLLEFSTHSSLEDSTSSKFSVTVTNEDLDIIEEERTYFYNLWSKHLTDDPRLQAYGKFSLQGAITPTT